MLMFGKKENLKMPSTVLPGPTLKRKVGYNDTEGEKKRNNKHDKMVVDQLEPTIIEE
jgi:hypothetical protein